MADGTGLSEAQQILFDAEQELADKAAAAKAAEAELDATPTSASSGMAATRREGEADGEASRQARLHRWPGGECEEVIMNVLVGPGGTTRSARRSRTSTSPPTVRPNPNPPAHPPAPPTPRKPSPRVPPRPRPTFSRTLSLTCPRPHPEPGTLQREEIVTFYENYIYQYTDFYTGQLRGAIAPAVSDTSGRHRRRRGPLPSPPRLGPCLPAASHPHPSPPPLAQVCESARPRRQERRRQINYNEFASRCGGREHVLLDGGGAARRRHHRDRPGSSDGAVACFSSRSSARMRSGGAWVGVCEWLCVSR